MNDIDRSAILLDLAAQLRAHGSWTGETHIQKAAYLMQELLRVPSGFKFVLYKHGPFSFDLRDSLNKLEIWGCIQTEEQPYPYGPKIVDGPMSRKLKMASEAQQEYFLPIQFVAQQIGKANVSELERVATALFIELDPNVKPEDRPERLVSLKPHISREEAPNAFSRLREVRSAAFDSGFAVQGSKRRDSAWLIRTGASLLLTALDQLRAYSGEITRWLNIRFCGGPNTVLPSDSTSP